MTERTALRVARGRPSIPPAVTGMAQRIVEAVSPAQVVLFGSHARGDAHPRSDVDLLVIMPDGSDETGARRAALHAVQGSPLPCDVVVATKARVLRLGAVVGAVFRPALREGRVLYDAAARPRWTRAGRPVNLGVAPVTEEQRLTQTRDWIEKAAEELDVAELAFQRKDPASSTACYLAQQAAEKALKAVLVFLQIDYPLTHELNMIREALPPGWPVKDEHPDLAWLSGWSVMGRYPGDWPQATPDDARAALDQARAVYEAVVRDLAEHGFQHVEGER